MLATITATLLMPLVSTLDLPTAVWQVAPAATAEFNGQSLDLKKTKDRAALLVHGLVLRVIHPNKAGKPELHEWQLAKSPLAQSLASDFDVFSFSYAQTTSCDLVASSPGMRDQVEKLRKAGYKEIVLIGHSAGGLIVRQFVERFPKSGVTKVLEVCAPNTGTELATIGVGLPKPQVPFIKSLAPGLRQVAAVEPIAIDDAIAFCAVVCKVRGFSHDTLVSVESQWPKDLQKQGIPAVLIGINHFDAMKAPHAVSAIHELAREKLVRWTPEQVEKGRQILFGPDADDAAIRDPKSKDRPFLRIIGKRLLDRYSP
jgi:pimeloyl-ACP methyl ester carboxylesterase